jgi:hypothetical protein
LFLVLLAIAVSLVPRQYLEGPLPDIGFTPHGDRVQGPPVGLVNYRDEIVVLTPALAFLAFVSSQQGFNHHLRYVLPAFPFIFVWASKVGRFFAASPARVGRGLAPRWLRRSMAFIITIALLGSAYSSLRAYPHSLSYFNEFVGGPANGHVYLGNSNADWGQDLWLLKAWYEGHPTARPLHLEYDMPLIEPNVMGIEYQSLPAGPVMNRAGTPKTPNWPWGDKHGTSRGDGRKTPSKNLRVSRDASLGPLPGWYIVSVNALHRAGGQFEYFQEFDPADRIGYSMNVYHISRDDANRVRRKLGMAPLPENKTDAR